MSTYADYLLAYLDAYDNAGVDIWGLTPVNEPHGNGGNWESMHFSPQSQNDFIKHHLGPGLRESGRDVIGFGVGAFLTLLVPGLNFLAMPALVISGTLLALRYPPPSPS